MKEISSYLYTLKKNHSNKCMELSINFNVIESVEELEKEKPTFDQ